MTRLAPAAAAAQRGVCDFADVEVAARIKTDPVRRSEARWLAWIVAAPAGEDVASQVARSGDVRPDREQLAIWTEYLDAIVLPVAHDHPPVGMAPDTVWQVELTGFAARLAP